LDVFALVLYVVAPLPFSDSCSLLGRDSMRFIRYFLLSNLGQNMILHASLLAIYF
jgi:hypothetical protein